MKVLLIYPPSVATAKTVEYISVGQPLGIAYLGARLEQEGIEVHLLDALMSGFIPGLRPEQLTSALEPRRVRVSKGVAARTDLGDGFPAGTFAVGMSPSAIAEEVRRLRPDVVGISVIFTSLYRMGLHVAKLVKAIDPHIVTIMGGSHVTVSPQEVLSHDTVDYIVVSEAEYALPSLVKTLEKRGDVSQIPGVGYRDTQGQPVVNPAQLSNDLDALPLPAFHLLPMEDYFATAAEGRIVKMYTSRGCTFTCSFCSVPYNSGRRLRAHSPERVLDEIHTWMDKYAITGLMFEDDNMNLNPKRVHRIFELLTEHDLGLKMYARNFRCDMLPLATLKLMKKAGFETIWITPESGNQRVLDQVVGKKMKLENIIRSVNQIREAGLSGAAAFVIGLPDEKWSEIQDTINFARKIKQLGISNFWFSIATPIEGTRMYHTAVEMGLIEGMNLDKFAYNEATFDTDEFTVQQLNELRVEVMDELNS